MNERAAISLAVQLRRIRADQAVWRLTALGMSRVEALSFILYAVAIRIDPEGPRDDPQ